MELTPILISIAAVSIGFYVQTIAGFAGSMVGLPVLFFAFSFQDSIALMAIFMLLFSAITIHQYWKNIDQKIFLELAIGSTIGLVLGIYLLQFGNPIIIKKGFGVFILLYIAHKYYTGKKVKLFDKLGLLFGFIGGVLSGLYNSGGPALITYITNKKTQGNIIRATLIGSLGFTNLLRVPLLIQNNILTYDIFLLSLISLPFFLLSLYLGHKSYCLLPEKQFKQIIMLLLTISAIMLIIK